MTPYDKLRSIGASVETADALAPILEALPERKREAFYLWAMGDSYRTAARKCGISKSSLFNLILELEETIDGDIRVS